MFIIEYEKYGYNQKLISTDVKDVRDIIVGIANDKRTEDEAYNWVCNAHFGDNFVNQKYKFMIKCVYDQERVYAPNDSRNKQPDIFIDKRKLQVIANEITRQTGIENEFIGEDNDSLTWDFATGVSYMKNKGGKGLYFALNDDNGVEICEVIETDVKEFIRKTVTVIKRREMSGGLNKSIKKVNKSKGFIMRNSEIVGEIVKTRKNKQAWRARIYDDKCWFIDMETNDIGNIRFWVGFEDKRSGVFNQSMFIIYRYNNELVYSCEFKVKEVVINKVKSVYTSLEKANLVRNMA